MSCFTLFDVHRRLINRKTQPLNILAKKREKEKKKERKHKSILDPKGIIEHSFFWKIFQKKKERKTHERNYLFSCPEKKGKIGKAIISTIFFSCIGENEFAGFFVKNKRQKMLGIL